DSDARRKRSVRTSVPGPSGSSPSLRCRRSECSMTTPEAGRGHERVGILWRGDRHSRPIAENRFFDPLAEAFAKLRVAAEPVLYADGGVPEVRDELLNLGAVLVWVDPIANGLDRTRLDALLREVSARGVWVSAHPDVILKMGTKEVLHRTRALGWG